MELFPDRLVSDLGRMPGASHSFLKQICSPDGAVVRAGLEAAVERLGEPLATRAQELLGSLDNRRFFQGFAEVATASALGRAGWGVRTLHPPGPRIELVSPRGTPTVLSVLAFVHQTRPGGEEETRKRLLDALDRVTSRRRIAVLVRRWLPHDFDPEPVRRAIDLWLTQVETGKWEGRYAAYDDEQISLEFCLTGERARARQSPVALTLGPFYAHRSLEVLEPRVVQELDRHRASSMRQSPLLLACVADQPWALNEGYLREFLYGRARRISNEDGVSEVEFGGSSSVCVFRDPLYAGVAGLLLVDRRPAHPEHVRVRAWLNPWATDRLSPGDVGLRCFAEDPEATERARARESLGGEIIDPSALRVARWYEGAGTQVKLA